jgi:hypothetical protein
VLKAFEALRFTGMPVCPQVIRSRALMQTCAAKGRSAEHYGRRRPSRTSPRSRGTRQPDGRALGAEARLSR